MSRNPIWEKILFNAGGEAWKASRNAMSPAFSTTKLRAMVLTVKEVSSELCRRLLEEGDKKQGVEIAKLYTDCTANIMAALAFTLDLNTEQNRDHSLVKCCTELFSDTTCAWKVVLQCECIHFCNICIFVEHRSERIYGLHLFWDFILWFCQRGISFRHHASDLQAVANRVPG